MLQTECYLRYTGIPAHMDHLHCLFHAELRDHTSSFRAIIVEQVQELTGCYSWDVLSLQLKREGKDPSKHGLKATNAVQQALQGELLSLSSAI